MRALIVIASHEGQTEQIATRMSKVLADNHVPTDIYDVVKMPADEIQIDAYDAVVIGSPLHFGHHDPRITFCVKQYSEFLSEVPTAFFSVSLGIVSECQTARREAKGLADEFLREVDWKPSMRECFAGALMYSKYGSLKQHLMHWIVKKPGEETKVDRNYEYTDWNKVEEFASRFASFVHSCKRPKPSGPRHRWSMQPTRQYRVC